MCFSEDKTWHTSNATQSHANFDIFERMLTWNKAPKCEKHHSGRIGEVGVRESVSIPALYRHTTLHGTNPATFNPAGTEMGAETFFEEADFLEVCFSYQIHYVKVLISELFLPKLNNWESFLRPNLDVGMCFHAVKIKDGTCTMPFYPMQTSTYSIGC